MRTTLLTNDTTTTSTQCHGYDSDRVGRLEIDPEMSELCPMHHDLALTI